VKENIRREGHSADSEKRQRSDQPFLPWHRHVDVDGIKHHVKPPLVAQRPERVVIHEGIESPTHVEVEALHHEQVAKESCHRRRLDASRQARHHVGHHHRQDEDRINAAEAFVEKESKITIRVVPRIVDDESG
jgi:hypothetical protein